MKKTSVLLGATALLSIALLGSACEREEKKNDTMEKDSMEMMDKSSGEAMMDDKMMDKDGMEDSSDDTAMVEGAAVYSVNATSSSMKWVGKKVTGAHEGNINLTEGSVQVVDGLPVSGNFVINMDSITVTDIEDPQSNQGLVDHLKNEDFFATAQFPTAMFALTECNKESGDNYTVKGELTIKGITQEISFPAVITTNENEVRATGTIEVDRTAFDIRYGSGSFFDDLGDRAIDDIFTLDLELIANAA